MQEQKSRPLTRNSSRRMAFFPSHANQFLALTLTLANICVNHWMTNLDHLYGNLTFPWQNIPIPFHSQQLEIFIASTFLCNMPNRLKHIRFNKLIQNLALSLSKLSKIKFFKLNFRSREMKMEWNANRQSTHQVRMYEANIPTFQCV